MIDQEMSKIFDSAMREIIKLEKVYIESKNEAQRKNLLNGLADQIKLIAEMSFLVKGFGEHQHSGLLLLHHITETVITTIKDTAITQMEKSRS